VFCHVGSRRVVLVVVSLGPFLPLDPGHLDPLAPGPLVSWALGSLAFEPILSF